MLSDAVTAPVPAAKRGDKPKPQTFPAGSIVVRMDQPYSRVADALLDRQFWAADDPQKHPYDDTGGRSRTSSISRSSGSPTRPFCRPG